MVTPGASAKIKIKLAGRILELGRKTGISSGEQFCLREGAKVVGVGIITNSLFEDAEHDDSL